MRKFAAALLALSSTAAVAQTSPLNGPVALPQQWQAKTRELFKSAIEIPTVAGRGEHKRMADFMAAQYPGAELWAAGFSFGSYIAMTCGAEDDRVCALIGIAPPVDRYDYSVVMQSSKAKFIVHGERDELIPLKAVREFYGRLAEPKELVEIDRANHLFDGQASEVGDALEDLLMDYSCTKP